jgi:hypothetical protein
LRVYFWTGAALLVLTAMTLLAFSVLTSREQARTPGEKNYGVAVLGLIFLPVILVLGACGTGLLVVSATALVYRNIARKNSTGTRERALS